MAFHSSDIQAPIGPEQITGLVLAGGLGQRMGQEKGLVSLQGQALAWHALQRLRPQVGPLALNANRQLAQYQALGVPVWADAPADEPQGPLAGMLCGLRHCQTDWLLTVPCDVPNFPHDLADRLVQALGSPPKALATVRAFTPDEGAAGTPRATSQGRPGPWRQPVFCLLHRSLEGDLAQWLHEGGRKVGAWLGRHTPGEAVFDRPQDQPRDFTNVNTPAELARLG